jgi:hypothetical protein
MKFITPQTLQNMPAYLANARARRASQLAEEERKEKKQYQQRLNEVGKAFIMNDNFTAEGLKDFAEKNNLSMPEVQGLMKIAVTYKQLQKQRGEQKNIWARDKDGVQRRVEDKPGVESYPEPEKPEKPSMVWARDKEGVQRRVPDAEGLESYPAPSQKEPDTDVPDYMKYAARTLGQSLGFTEQGGWPDEASGRKFNTVMQNVDALMDGEDPSKVNQVLFNAIKMYDQDVATAEVVQKIPKDTFTITVNDAKKFVKVAAEAGADPAVIEEELRRKQWDIDDIKKIFKDLGIKPATAKPANEASSEGMKPIKLDFESTTMDDKDPLGLGL